MEVTEKRAIGDGGVSVSVRLTDGEIRQIAERLVELLPRGVSGEGLIDAAEVARRLGISRSTVYERAEKGSARFGLVTARAPGFGVRPEAGGRSAGAEERLAERPRAGGPEPQCESSTGGSARSMPHRPVADPGRSAAVSGPHNAANAASVVDHFARAADTLRARWGRTRQERSSSAGAADQSSTRCASAPTASGGI